MRDADVPLDKVPTGPYGTAEQVSPEFLRRENKATLSWFVVTAPMWHPAWDQYEVALITLADIDGFPAAHKYGPEMTHEVMVYALNPDGGRMTAQRLEDGESPRHLLPVNVVQQFTARDDDLAREVCWLCVNAILQGNLCPETADNPPLIRAQWEHSIAMTIDHAKDPNHGRSN